MFKVLAGILMILVLQGCATSSENYLRTIALKKGCIGIIALHQDKLDDTTFAYLSELHRETLLSSFKPNGFKKIQYLHDSVVGDSAFVQSWIIEICRKNNLDAIVLSEISNVSVNTNYTASGLRPEFSPTGGIGISYIFRSRKGMKIDLDLEMKLVDKDGKFLMTSSGSSKQGIIVDNSPPEEILQAVIRGTANTIINKIKQKRY